MLFLDLNTRKKVHWMDYTTEEISLSCPHILEKSYMEYSKMFETVVDAASLVDPMLFVVDLHTEDKLDEADLMQFHQCLVSLFASKIVLPTARNEEKRLSAKIDGLYVHEMVLNKMINYTTRIDNFNIVLKCGDKVIDMTGGYYVESGI